MNKYNVHFKGRSRISTDSFNKINVSTFQFNFVNFQIKQFIIFQKLSWNLVQPIWSVTMNLTEITYSKISENMATVLFYRRKKRKHSCRNSGRSMLNQSKEVPCFVSRITRLNKRRTRNERSWHVFIILEKIVKQFKV